VHQHAASIWAPRSEATTMNLMSFLL